MSKTKQQTQDDLIEFLKTELVPCIQTLSILNDRLTVAEVDIKYFKTKEIEQNGLLRKLTTNVENLNFSLERQINLLRSEMDKDRLVVEKQLNAKLYKQTWTIITVLLIPLVITAVSLWIKSGNLPIFGG